MNLIQEIEQAEMAGVAAKRAIPDFELGDTVHVRVRVTGGTRTRLQAYEGVRPLSADEHAALPTLARGAALRFLLTRSYDWLNTDGEALVKRKNPNEYLRKLRFHRKVKSYRDYGLGEH